MSSVPAPDSLRSFSRINQSVYLYQPDDRSSKSDHNSADDPDLIILLSWGAAPPRNIVKYTTQYTTFYPRARILLIRTAFNDLIFHTTTSQQKPLAPAVDIILANPNRKTLVHLFSNAGAYKLRELAYAYQRTTGSRISFDSLILDSSPGRPHWLNSATAMKSNLPKVFIVRIVGIFIIYAYLFYLWLKYKLFGILPISQHIWDALNKETLIDPTANRLYIASRSDDMIEFDDVEAHRDVARQKGWRARLEEFVGSKHVAHPLVDKERYWRLVREHWEQRQTK